MDWVKSFSCRRRRGVSGKYVLIAGVGHCGTKWLAQTLDVSVAGGSFLHEHLYTLFKGTLPYPEVLRHEFEKGIDEFFDGYFRDVRQRLETRAFVGDSNSWPVCQIPAVDRQLRVQRILFLVRNGIPNVHSMHSTHTQWPRDHWVYTKFFPSYYEALSVKPPVWEKCTTFELWCHYWAINLHAVEWIRRKCSEPRVGVYRLEDLTASVRLIECLVRGISPELRVSRRVLKKMQEQDVNRKVAGNRSALHLWAQWPSEQKVAFKKICGEAMDYFSYNMPS